MRELTLSGAQLEAAQGGDAAGLRAVLGGAAPELPAEDRAAIEHALATSLHAPQLSGELRLRRDGWEQSYALTVGPLVTVVAPLEAGGVTVGFGTPQEFPRLIAELANLGPRPVGDVRSFVALPRDMVDACAGLGAPDGMIDELADAMVATAERADLAALLDGAAIRWTLTLGAAGSEPACIDVVDARDRGQWLVTEGPADDAVLLAPISTTVLWTLVCGVLDAALTPA